jgi:hypothetical protein
MNKLMMSWLSWLMMAGPVLGQAPLDWKPNHAFDRWLLDQRWQSRVAHVRLILDDGRKGDGQVLWGTADSMLWQPSHGPASLGEKAFWVKREEIAWLEWQHRPKVWLPFLRTVVGTMCTFQAFSWLLSDNHRDRLFEEGVLIWGAVRGIQLGLGVAAFKAIDRGRPRRYLRQVDGPLSQFAFRTLAGHSAYRKHADRSPFWELWPQKVGITFQIETGHIVNPQRLIEANLNLPGNLSGNPHPETTRFHSFSLSYQLNSFSYAGLRFSPKLLTDEYIRPTHPPFVGQAGYRLRRGGQWGGWLASDLIPWRKAHLLRAYCQVGAGVFWQPVQVNHFVEVEAYQWEWSQEDIWNLRQEKTSQWNLLGGELFLRVGYRFSTRLGVTASIRQQWTTRAGKVDDIFLQLPSNPDVAAAEFKLSADDLDQRPRVVNMGLEFRL